VAEVFISYSKSDRTSAEHLARKIATRGISVWWDRSLISGEDFEEVIFDQISKVKALVVIWTSSSVKSEWVCREVAKAIERGILIPTYDSDTVLGAIPQFASRFHSIPSEAFDKLELALEDKGVKFRTTSDSATDYSAGWNLTQPREGLRRVSSSELLSQARALLVSARNRRTLSDGFVDYKGAIDYFVQSGNWNIAAEAITRIGFGSFKALPSLDSYELENRKQEIDAFRDELTENHIMLVINFVEENQTSAQAKAAADSAKYVVHFVRDDDARGRLEGLIEARLQGFLR
jgi:hypothetical protein